MVTEVFFEPENEEFNLYIDDNEIEDGGRFKNIKWKNAQLELFEKFKEIRQNIWIQLYHVFLDDLGNVIGIGFRITPEASFYHEYPNIEFDMNGFIIGDLKTELKNIKTTSQKWYKLVNNFYKVLIKLQEKQVGINLVKDNINIEKIIN